MPYVPVDWRDDAEHRRIISKSVNLVSDGHTRGAGSVTLTASTSTTVVSDFRVGVDTVVFFMPKTANAAAELGNGTMYVSARDKEEFTLTHASNAQTDRDFEYALFGTGRGN